MSNKQNPGNLGSKLAEVKPNRIFFFFTLGVGLLLSVCSLTGLATNLSNDISRANLITFITMLLIGIAATWVGFNRSLRNAETFIAYANGISHTKKGVETNLYWNDVTQIFKTSFVDNFGNVKQEIWRLVDRDGNSLHIGNRAEIGRIAEQKVWPNVWNQVVTALEQGSTVNFGPLNINQIGISHNNQTIPWSEFKTIQLGRIVQVFTNDKKIRWENALSSQIPNLPLLKKAINKYQPGGPKLV